MILCIEIPILLALGWVANKCRCLFGGKKKEK